jgi:transposase
MAMTVRTGEEIRQVQMVCLDELVPADDRLRRIERLVNWGAVRATAAPFYTDFGRPSVDPVVLVKLLLVGALRGVGSLRELMRVAEVDLSIRRFLGYGLTETLPHHSTLSHAQCVRFASSSVFEQLFTQVLAQCRQAGLMDGGRLVVDATHVEADAALKSLRAQLTVIDGDGHDSDDEDRHDGDGDGEGGQRPPLALAEPRSGPTPKRTATNKTAVSRTDPDGKLRHKPGQRPHLVHRVQVAADPKHRVIVAVQAEQASGFEGDSLPELVRRARWAGHHVNELAADQGYASRAVYEHLEQQGVTAFIPPQAAHARTVCEAARARARCRTPAGISAILDRQAHAEGAISELKLRHGVGRARRRGTKALQVQLLLAATAVNLKRLLTRPDAAGNSAAGGHAGAARRLRATFNHHLARRLRATVARHTTLSGRLITPQPASSTGS